MKTSAVAVPLVAILTISSGAYAGSPYYGAGMPSEAPAALRSDATSQASHPHCIVSRRAAAQYKTGCRFSHI